MPISLFSNYIGEYTHMGATKGYHPVSLHVIRGSAEFGGFKFGKIKKIAEFPEKQKVVYVCDVERAPRGADDWPPKVYRRALQHCFMDDIRVTTVRLSTSGDTTVVLTVQLNRSPMDAEMERVQNDGQ
jgi:hypothetical protein